MNRSKYEIAMLVKELLELKIEEQRRRRWTDRLRFGGRPNVVTHDTVDIDPSGFKILSQTKNTNGDTLIEWEAIGHVKSSFIVSNLDTIRRSGTLIIRSNGDAELL